MMKRYLELIFYKLRGRYFSISQEKKIVEAIREAEKNTTAEFRLHVEFKKAPDVYKRSIRVFEEIGMAETKEKNGVLFYLNPFQKEFSIIGDTSFNDCVSPEYWEEIKAKFLEEIKVSKPDEALIPIIKELGDKLSQFFPGDGEENPNELPDSISRA